MLQLLNAILTSPADSNISSGTVPLSAAIKLKVKGMSLSVSELLGGDPVAAELYGGTAASFGLGVTDYHRFHSPVSGHITKMKILEGLYFGMDTFAEFFTENHRGYCIIETFVHGKVAVIPIGITTISSVVFVHKAGDDIIKGKELGNFAYGGSAILVLFQPDYFELFKFSENEHVQLGQKVGTLK